MQGQKQTSFACESCRSGKRKCDGLKPKCSLCTKQNRSCVYKTEAKARKRKYWDEDYVRALEDQVQSLLAVINDQNHQNDPRPSTALDAHRSLHGSLRVDAILAPHHSSAINPSGETLDVSTFAEDRAQKAMEELSVMMWRTNVGDGVTIMNDASTGTVHCQQPAEAPVPISPVNPPDVILRYCQDQELLEELAVLFLDHINQEHQFTTYTSADFLAGYPYQRPDLAFLHSSILSVGATFSTRPDRTAIGDVFAQFAESLAFTCIREDPTVAVVQGLCMQSWRSLALGRDHLGWTFISMAAGTCVHLRLHVLALEEVQARAFQPDAIDVRTFWMFYIIDRTAISILGRNCVLPWRRVNVPNFDTTYESNTADLAQLSFGWQCRLWYLHDHNMDQIFSTTFESLPISQQVRLLVATHEALNNFFKGRDRRLDLKGDDTSKHVLLFHMAYQMALLITMPPFLRLFSTPKAAEIAGSNTISLILRSLTYAATAIARLVRTYRKVRSFDHPNPVMIHHLLSASIVHLMNATSSSPSMQKQSARWLRLCVELLLDLKAPWPNRVDKSLRVIRILANRWGVNHSLPLEYAPSYVVDLAQKEKRPHEPARGVSSESIPRSDPTSGDLPLLNIPLLSSEQLAEFDSTGTPSRGTFDPSAMNIPGGPSFDTSGFDFLQVFEGLNNSENFDWLLGESNFNYNYDSYQQL